MTKGGLNQGTLDHSYQANHYTTVILVFWALRYDLSKNDSKYLERTLSFSSDSKLNCQWRIYISDAIKTFKKRNKSAVNTQASSDDEDW